jgi:peptide/nickel transport system permease protein
MLEVLNMDYIKTAWSKGCTPKMVYYKHAFRNALLPIITLVGLRIPRLFMGSVLAETVFTWPGLGMLMYAAILERDYNLLLSIFTMFSILMIVSNILADISYAYLDPRIRYE